MGIEIRAKNGKKLGFISDSESEEDYFIVNNKKVSQSTVYADSELKDSFNQSIKKSSIDLGDTNGKDNQ